MKNRIVCMPFVSMTNRAGKNIVRTLKGSADRNRFNILKAGSVTFFRLTTSFLCHIKF